MKSVTKATLAGGSGAGLLLGGQVTWLLLGLFVLAMAVLVLVVCSPDGDQRAQRFEAVVRALRGGARRR
jgi:Na+/pantothenate symporter